MPVLLLRSSICFPFIVRGSRASRPSASLVLLLTAADFDEVVTALSTIPNDSTSKLADASLRSIAKLAVMQSLCDDAARVALNLRHRALAACLRRAAELTPITLVTTG
eukprot:COSAG02_NODE_47340_length_342_cov_0.522634_1_plen_107_part_01